MIVTKEREQSPRPKPRDTKPVQVPIPVHGRLQVLSARSRLNLGEVVTCLVDWIDEQPPDMKEKILGYWNELD